MGCFSFYPTKIITTLEGGMITTDDEKIDQRLRLLREHGMNRNAMQRELGATWAYDVVDLGYNYRLTEPQAALGMTQLEKADENTKRRVRAASYYTKQLSGDSSITTPYTAPNRSHIFHLYTIRIESKSPEKGRNEVFKNLADSGIQSSVHYTPLHMMSFYKPTLNDKRDCFPVAERIYEEILTLPLYPSMTKTQTDVVSAKVKEVLR